MATTNPWQRTGAPDGECAQESARRLTLKGKRIFDVVLSATGLVVCLPLMALWAAAVCLESRGPALLRIRCWGAGARTFEQFRLRVEDAQGGTTGAGRLLARLRLDALPQLINVLRGEMSIVGPAPIPADGSADVREGANVRHLRRFAMKPGMTGMSAMGSCEDCLPGSYFSPESSYGSQWSVWRDLAIVARVIAAIPSSAH